MTTPGRLSRTSLNVLTSIVSYGVSLAVALTYTPFLVWELGLAAYGVIALSFVLVQYAGPVSQTITASISQRLAQSRSDPEKSREVFSTAVTLVISRSGAVLGPGSGRALTIASLYPFGWTLVAAGITYLLAGSLEPVGFGALALIGLLVSVPYAAVAFATLPASDRCVVLGVFRRLTHRAAKVT